MVYINDCFTSRLLEYLKVYDVWIEIAKKPDDCQLDIAENGFRYGFYICIAYEMAEWCDCLYFYGGAGSILRSRPSTRFPYIGTKMIFIDS